MALLGDDEQDIDSFLSLADWKGIPKLDAPFKGMGQVYLMLHAQDARAKYH